MDLCTTLLANLPALLDCFAKASQLAQQCRPQAEQIAASFAHATTPPAES